MSNSERNYKKRLDDLLRNAPKRLSAHNREQFRQEAIRQNAAHLATNALDVAARRADGKIVRLLDLSIQENMAKLSRLTARRDRDERIMLKAELAWLRDAKNFFKKPNLKPRRKPPESGLAVPVEPPKGPKPKLGGAEAPLDFDDSRA